jgi:hypothetical protein
MERILMLKINLLAITVTSLLSACASNSPPLAQETPLINKVAKGEPNHIKTSRSSVSVPAKSTCNMDMTTGRRPIPIVDFDNSVLDHSKGFLPNGAITCALTTDLLYPVKSMFRKYAEKGSFEGFDYEVRFNRGSIFLASSPNTAKWSISCKQDQMEDVVTCSMNKRGKLPLFVHLGSDGETTSFGLVTETYPSTEIAVKVGSNAKVAATSMGGLLSKSEITEQMKTNTTLITSYYDWPYKVKKVETHNIEGFSAGLTLMKKLHSESVFN